MFHPRTIVSRFTGSRFTPGAIAGLTLLAAGCGSSSSSTSPTTGGSTSSGTLVTIFITNGVFSPNPLTVQVGQRVNWKNNDTFAHTATSDGRFNTGSIAPTSAADDPVMMSAAGTLNFHCTIHAGENGSIVVQP